MKICYFTATGNCLYVAKKIGRDLLSIPQLMRQETIEITDDAVGLLCLPAQLPQSAIYTKVEKNTVHFRNEHVSLQDIIEANE